MRLITQAVVFWLSMSAILGAVPTTNPVPCYIDAADSCNIQAVDR